MTLKYVITNKLAFAIFPKSLTHKDVASALEGKPIGAGFCHFTPGDDETAQFVCYGESVSLKVKSRGAVDASIINDTINAEF